MIKRHVGSVLWKLISHGVKSQLGAIKCASCDEEEGERARLELGVQRAQRISTSQIYTTDTQETSLFGGVALTYLHVSSVVDSLSRLLVSRSD